MHGLLCMQVLCKTTTAFKQEQQRLRDVFGIQYYGRLCNFGESVLAAISPAHHKKGNVKFVKMTWVGKTLNNNMNICLGPHGAYVSRSVRRLVNPACWDVPLIKQVTGYPWSYGLGQIGTKLVPGLKQREPQSESIFMGILPPVHADASGLRNQMMNQRQIRRVCQQMFRPRRGMIRFRRRMFRPMFRREVGQQEAQTERFRQSNRRQS